MANFVRLSYLTDYHGLLASNVYKQLESSAEFRDALAAKKQGGIWYVDEDRIPLFRPRDWNVYGMRRVEIDLAQYTKVLELDYQIEKNRKVRFLISSSKAIASALGVTRFNGFPALYILTDLLNEFKPEDWIYCPDLHDWARVSERKLALFSKAVKNAKNPRKTSALFSVVPEVRKALGAVKLAGDRRWWIDKNLLKEFDPDLWTYRGERRESRARELPPPPGPRTFSRELAKSRKPGMLSLREAAWEIRWNRHKLREYIIQPAIADLLGAYQTEKGHWFVDEIKLRIHFNLSLI